MGHFFSKHKKGPQITEADKAVLSLKTQRRKLTTERQRIEGLIDRELQAARDLIAAKKKQRALIALKKKKLQEQQVIKIDAWLLNVEQLLSNIETSKQQGKLFDALRQGHTALKELQSQVTIDDVEKLMEDTAEAKAYQDHLSELLGQSLTESDDVAVMHELDELEAAFQEAEAEELPAVPTLVVEVEEEEQPAAEGAEDTAEAVQHAEQPATRRAEEPIAAQ